MDSPDLFVSANKIKEEALSLFESHISMLETKLDVYNVHLKIDKIDKLVEDNIVHAKRKNKTSTEKECKKIDEQTFKQMKNNLEHSHGFYDSENIKELHQDFATYQKDFKKQV